MSSMRYIHADNFREGFVLNKLSQKPPFTTSYIDDAIPRFCATRP